MDEEKSGALELIRHTETRMHEYISGIDGMRYAVERVSWSVPGYGAGNRVCVKAEGGEELFRGNGLFCSAEDEAEIERLIKLHAMKRKAKDPSEKLSLMSEIGELKKRLGGR